MASGRNILSEGKLKLTIERLCHQLLENHGDFEETCVIAMQKGGVPLADRIVKRLPEIAKMKGIEYGKVDVTFYRDDFRIRKSPLEANRTEIDFLIENKRVVLIDDVLYSGRTVAAALSALQHYGRPKEVELLVLVDRRFNRTLPIEPKYYGISVDALDEAYVKVEWEEIEGISQVLFFQKKESV